MIRENDDEHEDDQVDDATDQDTGKTEKTDLDPNDPFAGQTEEQIEARARRNGWIKPEDWDDARAEREGRRKPTNFITAREFLSRIERETPMLRERYRRSEQQVDKLTKEVGELKKQTSELGDLLRTQHNMSLEAKKKAYEKGIADEKAKQRAAVKDGDEAAYEKAEESIEQLQREKAELDKLPKKKPKAEDAEGDDDDDDVGDDRRGKDKDEKPDAYLDKLDPETRAWCTDPSNKWFRNDLSLNGYMIEMNGEVRRENPDWSRSEVLAEAKRRTMDKFPEKFGKNRNREGNGAVITPSGGDRGARDPVSKKFDALPPEAKTAYEHYRKIFEGRNPKEKYTKEQYLADYHDA